MTKSDFAALAFLTSIASNRGVAFSRLQMGLSSSSTSVVADMGRVVARTRTRQTASREKAVIMHLTLLSKNKVAAAARFFVCLQLMSATGTCT